MAIDHLDTAGAAPTVAFPRVADGYDPEAVDDFVRQLTARVELLKELVHQAVERSEAAEAALAEATNETAEPAPTGGHEVAAGAGDVVVIAERPQLQAALLAAIDDAGGYPSLAARAETGPDRP